MGARKSSWRERDLSLNLSQLVKHGEKGGERGKREVSGRNCEVQEGGIVYWSRREARDEVAASSNHFLA